MRLRKNGFVLTLTKPVDPKTAEDLASYELETYTYIYREQYGSPEVDHTEPTIQSIHVSDDGLKVELVIEGLQIGHVHELHAKGLRAKTGEPLLHSDAYYTLNHLVK